MVSENTLKYLASQKKKDAEILYREGRNSGAIYLMGYAVELSFKRKIVQTLGFTNGFPETTSEFKAYNAQISSFTAIKTGIILSQLRHIKNHNLDDLIKFSGAESRIISSYYNQWLIVKTWNPENRYKRYHYTNVKTKEFIDSAKKILKQIS